MTQTKTKPSFELFAKGAAAADGFYWAVYLGKLDVGTVRGILEHNRETGSCNWSIEALDEKVLLSGEAPTRADGLNALNRELGYLADPDSADD